jgi:DNA segregation ATPase FtsK/SpoIIIE, S-DNA-T family
MAKRRSKKSKKRAARFEISEGLKQSILAIVFVAAAALFLFSFFGLAGSVGIFLNDILSDLFGLTRWFFAIALLVAGWGTIFPDRGILRPLHIVGVILFFISVNGILNLLLTDPGIVDVTTLSGAGGYIGLVISSVLVGVMGAWGSGVVALALFAVSLLLLFNTSFDHMVSLRGLFSREDDGEEYEDEWEEDAIDEDEEEYEDEEDAEEEVGVTPAPRFAASNDSEKVSESVMTSRRRRRMEIPMDLLDQKSSDAKPGDIDKSSEIISRTFDQFGIDVEVREVRVGPSVTQYALKPAEGVKLARIVALQNDLALALAAHPIRIEAPIPGRSLVGIEVPNQSIGSVTLRELLESKEFKHRKSSLSAPLGKDVSGKTQMVLVDKAPHMLVAGATGSGKSVCLNVIIASLLYQNGPDDLKIIMVDPKRVELGIYAGMPHLLVPPIVKVEEAINALKWAVREMERRLDHLAKAGVRDIDSYNKKNKERMPKIVIVIDELADLMSQNKRDVEAVIVRIAQMARAAGIHLVLATQRPSVDVITGTIKANIPTRLAFSVASQVDSKTIIDMAGAEKLLGRGDMLMSTPSLSKPHRVQGAYISDDEIGRIVKFLKKEGEPDYDYNITEDTRTGGTSFSSDDADPLLRDAANIVIESGKASTSFLQRRLKIGYSRAARIIDTMEEMGIVGPPNGSKPREVFTEAWPDDETDMAEEVPEDEEDYGEDEESYEGEEESEEDEDDVDAYVDEYEEEE